MELIGCTVKVSLISIVSQTTKFGSLTSQFTKTHKTILRVFQFQYKVVVLQMHRASSKSLVTPGEIEKFIKLVLSVIFKENLQIICFFQSSGSTQSANSYSKFITPIFFVISCKSFFAKLGTKKLSFRFNLALRIQPS